MYTYRGAPTVLRVEHRRWSYVLEVAMGSEVKINHIQRQLIEVSVRISQYCHSTIIQLVTLDQ